MPETRESLLQHFHGVRAHLLAAIDGLTDAQMTEPTLDGWSVKDNLAHIALWDDLRAGEVLRLTAGHATVLAMTPEQDLAANALAHDLRKGLALGQVRWELAHSHQRLLAAIRSAAGNALDPANYGEAGILSTHDAQHADYIRAWRVRMGY